MTGERQLTNCLALIGSEEIYPCTDSGVMAQLSTVAMILRLANL